MLTFSSAEVCNVLALVVPTVVSSDVADVSIVEFIVLVPGLE